MGMKLSLRYNDLKKLASMKRREAMRVALSLRQKIKRPRGRRDISDTLRLAMLAIRSLDQYIEVISWSRDVLKERVVRIR